MTKDRRDAHRAGAPHGDSASDYWRLTVPAFVAINCQFWAAVNPVESAHVIVTVVGLENVTAAWSAAGLNGTVSDVAAAM